MALQDVRHIEWLTRKLERLSQLDDEDKAALSALPLRHERVDRWTRLVREGDKPEHCCLLVSGYACRSKMGPKGGRQIVSFHLRGDILDVQHILLPTADHEVQSITEADVAWIPRTHLLRLAWERPAIGKALWRDSLVDASIFREWVLNVGRRDGKARIAHMLCEFAARCQAAGLGSADSFHLPMTQEQIGDATGLTSVHVNRMLRLLDEDGAISREGRQLQIKDWDRLRKIGDFDPAYLHAAA
jgi:CRP-like cAMP-binding protein